MIEQLSATNAPVLVGLIVLSMTLVRLVERLIDNRLTKRNGKKSIAPPVGGGCRGLTEEEHAALMRLDDSHAKYDSDGTPLWYVPRSLGATLEKIAVSLDKTAVRQRDILKIQQDILDRIRRWEDSTSRIEVSKRMG